MSTFEAEVRAARQAALNAWGLRQALDERDAALARAWALRPGGMTWAQLVDEVCRTLPAGARFSRSTARAAKRQHAVTMTDCSITVPGPAGTRAGSVQPMPDPYALPAQSHEAPQPPSRPERPVLPAGPQVPGRPVLIEPLPGCPHPLSARRLSDDGHPYCRTCGADVEG